MTETTEVATLPPNGDVAQWSDAQKAIVEAAGLVFKHNYGPKQGEREAAPRAVVEKFLHTARKTGLDPLTRQLYCIGRLSGGTVEWSVQTSIDGFRVIAERSGQYAGQDDAEWLTKDGTWTDVFVKELHGDHPLAARVRVHRHDWTRPASGVAVWDSYVQTKRDGTPTQMWEKMGPLMIAKCAEALALRKAFPQDLSGLYTADEMSQAQPVEAVAERSQETTRAAVASADAQEPPKTAQASAQQRSEPVASSSSAPIATQPKEGGRDWRAEADATQSADRVLAIFNECRDAGQLGQTTDVGGERVQLRVYLRKRGETLRAAEVAKETSDDEIVEGEIVDDGAPAVLDESIDADSQTGVVRERDEHTTGGHY